MPHADNLKRRASGIGQRTQQIEGGAEAQLAPNMSDARGCSLKQCSTVSGEAAVLTPNASSTSALPRSDVAAREPCLATGKPAPAMTKAAAVETLKVFARLEPVPAVSMKRA